jgi:leucyl-tRNA synthetase
MYNVVNPDTIVENFGADTLRLYEMFLGPLEQSKPWDTNGIDGCHRFLRKIWNIFFDKEDNLALSDEAPSREELKSIHKLIKKVSEDIPNFSYNTAVSAFMICANELSALKCNKRAVMELFAIVLSPFAPHLCEELWAALGYTTTICDAEWPAFNEEYLKEDSIKYTISFNGKARFTMDFATEASREEIEAAVIANEQSQKYIDGKSIKKVIVVPKKIVNIVIG